MGKNRDIGVPAMFFKILVKEDGTGPVILVFLFPHQRLEHGEIQDFLVSVDVIEALTGLDFFRELDDNQERMLERQDTWVNWGRF